VCAHAPFGLLRTDEKYFTDRDWQSEEITVPEGSQIIKVNGMDCTTYLNYLENETFLRYWAFTKTIAKDALLIINEGHALTGWEIDFLLPDKSIQHAFVPKLNFCPGHQMIRTQEPQENCTCIELTDEIAYIRIKKMISGGMLSFIFPSMHNKDRKIIKAFLDDANGKYRKLIIDVRDNAGGMPHYFYRNLIQPFLDEPVTYDQVAGIRRKYRDNLKPSVLKTLRMCSRKKEHVINTEEIQAPEGFDSKDWVFYRLTRTIEPRNRYSFDGNLYVLVNGGTFSAADDFANAVKRIGFAKLVGRNTRGGCAAYIGPPVIRLPNSGMIFRVETEIVINPDGSINELYGTPPDIKLPEADPPASITKEDLLKDTWIQKIIYDL
jgi:hypothetical protein